MSQNEDGSDEERPLLNSSHSNSTDEEFDSTSTVDSVEFETRHPTWLPILLGQIASVLICLSGITSIKLTDYGLAFPSIQNFCAYFLISAVFTTKLALGRKDGNHTDLLEVFKSRGWKYLLITVSDVGGNYLMVRAYQFTSLTSVQLLDCFSIPTVLALSYVFLRARYGHFHYLGIVLSLLGVVCLVWADIQSGRTSEGNMPVIGDMMCLAGAFLYGVSNVSQEFFVKNFNPTEFLAFVGFFGCSLSAAQLLALDSYVGVEWTLESCLYLLSYALVMLLFYGIVAHLMVMSSSVALNLSILSADFYAILVGLLLFNYSFSILYFLSFMFVLGGVGIFSLRPIRAVQEEEEQQAPIPTNSSD